MSRVVIFGTGAFARVAEVYLRVDSPHDVVGFTVHQQYVAGDTFQGLPLVPFEAVTARFPPTEFAMFVAIGFSKVNKTRAGIYQQAKDLGYQLITYVNSKAITWGETSIGDNCFIFEQNVIQPFVTIGNDVILWSGNHIGHDAAIGNHCFIASHAVISGHARVGDYCFIGVNATLRDGVTIAPECVIGAGALILRDTQQEQVFGAKGTEPSAIPSSRLRGF